MLVLQHVPYVNGIIVAAAKHVSTAQRQAARCKSRIRVRWLIRGELLIGSDVPQPCRLVLRRCHESLPGGMILEEQIENCATWNTESIDEDYAQRISEKYVKRKNLHKRNSHQLHDRKTSV